MDSHDPKTRKEQKGGKYKAVFNAKTIRLKEALAARASVPATTKSAKKK